MSDHWGGFDHHDDDLPDSHDLPDLADSHDLPDAHDLPDLPEHHDPEPLPDWDHHSTGHDADLPDHDVADPPGTPSEVADDFPPTLDVGDLPEPVDGFPWVDASTLGTADTYTAPADPVDPHDLAAYAGVEVPDGTDPWAALATSDDPAVAALARWWTPGDQ
jgi:hypothetical protein